MLHACNVCHVLACSMQAGTDQGSSFGAIRTLACCSSCWAARAAEASSSSWRRPTAEAASMSASDTPAAVLIWAPLERSCAASRAWLRFHSFAARLQGSQHNSGTQLTGIYGSQACGPAASL
jgi:hypothetical protein